MIRAILLSAVLAATFTVPTAALADPPAAPSATIRSLTRPAAGPLASAAVRHAAWYDLVVQQPGSPVATTSRKGRVAKKVVGAIAGGVGGFFLGGVLGAKLEPNCGCDDPGLKGFLIGAPIGAVAGAVLGSMVD